MPGLRTMEADSITKATAEQLPFETWSAIAACLSDDKATLRHLCLLSSKTYHAAQPHLFASVDLCTILQRRKSAAVVQLTSAIPHSSIWADHLKSITFPWLTPHLAPHQALDVLLKISAACSRISSVGLVMAHPPKHDWTSATAILRETLNAMPSLAEVSYTRSKACPFLTFIRTMNTLTDSRDWLQDGKKGSRLGKVDLGLLRSQEDVHQSLIELEPRTYLFSAKELIVRLPRYPIVATIRAITALFTCENLSLSLASTPEKINLVFDHLDTRVINLELDVTVTKDAARSAEAEKLNISRLKALKRLRISRKTEWTVAEQLINTLPNNLEVLDYLFLG